jgi:hypothetical protein
MEACRIRLKDVEEVRMIKIRNSLNYLKDMTRESRLDTVTVRRRCPTLVITIAHNIVPSTAPDCLPPGV